jgi:AcrR family transcriptional regulator
MLKDMSAAITARARVRSALTEEIVDAARAEMVEWGAAGLSLRAVARRLGMVPSALYRYFPSRDAILTRLIVDAYRQVGAVAETAEREAGPGPRDRWRSMGHAVRRWAAAHPQEWALIYGSPVPGYQAPPETVEAALVISQCLTRVVADAWARSPQRPPGLASGPAEVMAPVEQLLLPGVAPELVSVALLAWIQLIGTVSLELAGHFVGAVTDFEVVFAHHLEVVADLLGLPE